MATEQIDSTTPNLKEHVPCARCRYDLFGHSCDERCPDCDLPASVSLDPRRLLFADVSVLRGLRRAAIVSMTGIVGLVGVQLLPLLSYGFQEPNSMCILAVIALLSWGCTELCISYLRWRRARHAFLIVGFLAIAGLVLLTPAAARAAYQLGVPFIDLSWVPGHLWFGAWLCAQLSFHLLAASIIRRVPSSRCAMLLVAGPFMELATWPFVYWFFNPGPAMGWGAVTLFVFVPVADFVMRLVGLGASVWVLSRVMDQRKALEHGPLLPGRAERRWVRRTGMPRALRGAAAVLSFPFLLLAAAYLSEAIFDQFWKFTSLVDYIAIGYGLSETLALGIIISVCVVSAYLASRLLYTGLVWRRVDTGLRVCDRCAYDLTGNQSACCPECGRKFNPSLLMNVRQPEQLAENGTECQSSGA